MERGEPTVPASMLIALVRHGATPFTECGRIQGRRDVPLSEAGRGQAAAVAARLGREPWNALYTSPLSRAADTAAAIAEITGLAVQPDPRLEERDLGPLAGLTRRQYLERYPDGTPTGLVEPREAVRQRALACLTDIERRHRAGRVIVVAHGGVIAAILADCLGLEELTEPVYIDTGSVSIIEYVPPDWRVIIAGDGTHLEGLS